MPIETGGVGNLNKSNKPKKPNETNLPPNQRSKKSMKKKKTKERNSLRLQVFTLTTQISRKKKDKANSQNKRKPEMMMAVTKNRCRTTKENKKKCKHNSVWLDEHNETTVLCASVSVQIEIEPSNRRQACTASRVDHQRPQQLIDLVVVVVVIECSICFRCTNNDCD